MNKLKERQRVRLTVEDWAEVKVYPAERNDRKEEMAWLASEASPYKGDWVALSGWRLVAHGPEASAVSAAARAAGVERPLLVHLAEDNELPFGGW